MILAGIVGFVACAELNSGYNDNQKRAGCYTSSPLEELVWLKELTDGLKKSMLPMTPKVYQYTYQKDTLFTLEQGDKIMKVYDCSGSLVALCEEPGTDLCSKLSRLQDSTKKLIWENRSW